MLKEIASLIDSGYSVPDALRKVADVFSNIFTSSEQTITAAGSLTIAHGLSASPSLVQLRLICKTAEFNYSIGDEVIVDSGQQSSSGTDHFGVSCVIDATNLNIRYGSSTNTFIVLDKTTGSGSSITDANWKLVIRAWV